MFTMFSPWILGQIGLPMAVFESAHHEDSETTPTCLIWWSSDWDIQGRRKGSISKQKIDQEFMEKTLESSWWCDGVVKALKYT